MSYTSDMKKIKELEEAKRNAVIRTNYRTVTGVHPWTGETITTVEYDEYVDTLAITKIDAEIRKLEEANAEAIAKAEAKRKADKAKRYRKELEELELRKTYLEKWLSEYEEEA